MPKVTSSINVDWQAFDWIISTSPLFVSASKTLRTLHQLFKCSGLRSDYTRKVVILHQSDGSKVVFSVSDALYIKIHRLPLEGLSCLVKADSTLFFYRLMELGILSRQTELQATKSIVYYFRSRRRGVVGDKLAKFMLYEVEHGRKETYYILRCSAGKFHTYTKKSFKVLFTKNPNYDIKEIKKSSGVHARA